MSHTESRYDHGFVNGPWYMFHPREISARRARTLRKRGENIQYAGRTSTGKARYWWDALTDEEQSRG